jgi:hypothetical protein
MPGDGSTGIRLASIAVGRAATARWVRPAWYLHGPREANSIRVRSSRRDLRRAHRAAHHAGSVDITDTGLAEGQVLLRTDLVFSRLAAAARRRWAPCNSFEPTGTFRCAGLADWNHGSERRCRVLCLSLSGALRLEYGCTRVRFHSSCSPPSISSSPALSSQLRCTSSCIKTSRISRPGVPRRPPGSHTASLQRLPCARSVSFG